MLFHIEYLRYQLDDTYAFLQKRSEQFVREGLIALLVGVFLFTN